MSEYPSMGEKWQQLSREEMEAMAVHLAMRSLHRGDDARVVVIATASAVMDWVRGKKLEITVDPPEGETLETVRRIASTLTIERLVEDLFDCFTVGCVMGLTMETSVTSIVKTALELAALNPALAERPWRGSVH